MRRLLIALLASSMLAPGAMAQSVQSQVAPAQTRVTGDGFVQPNEAQLQEHGHYTNRFGKVVHAPAHSVNGGAPTGATAKCGDGTYSFSQHHSGTCSHHHGVDQWLGE